MTSVCRTSRISTAAPPLSVAQALSRSGFYPGNPAVTVCETHTARVFLAADRAYKIKKPVRMKFLDFSTIERRRLACLEELRVNEELAPGVCLRLHAVLPLSDSYVLADAPNAEAVEYVIEMRRFDETRSMAALADRGELAGEQVRATARRLASFHAAARCVAPADHADDVLRACQGNLRELLATADDATARRILSAERFVAAFVVTHRHELAARAEEGHVRDGHGDLRAEHVVLEDPLVIVDRLEFDARLREIDVADDLGFLAMDLERLGARDAARQLVAAYREAGGDPGSDELLAFYGSYRALVRAKVALLRADQLDDAACAAVAREEAAGLFDLAERLAWRARGPCVLAISGPPASGKSTLAASLSRRTGWAVLSSDIERRHRRGLAASTTGPETAYTPAARAAIYSQLGARARGVLGQGHGTIVDATFGDPQLRAAFLEGLGSGPRLYALECQTTASARAQRVRTRTRAQAHGSDVTPTVAAELGASHSSWDELPDEAILPLRSGVDVHRLVDQIADFVDARTSVVSRSDTRTDTE